ncbi:hypothetical protein OBK19_12365 [Empedobacter falsenii]|uniref:Uncharacterized protein n=1 Tax=Empedobacter falsenii TaxID=343874 RepID=A0ABY8VAN3_9FLAO|nr:hypothetical protein [Empedobacter falsenii]WIH98212.1 hypothetical protein OBA43_04590 [Empedobacter falsenii]
MQKNKSTLTLGTTYYIDTKTISYIRDENNASRYSKFYGVHLVFDEYPEVKIFSKLDDLLEDAEHRDNYFCFYKTEDNCIYILDIRDSDNVFGAKHIHSKSLDWKLYINSANNVVVKHREKDLLTDQFSFLSNQELFIQLSCLYYLIRNYKFNKENALKNKFDDLLGCINTHK